MTEPAAAPTAERTDVPADAVLVLVDHQGSGVRGTALELITLGRTLGTAHVVWIGDGLDGALPTLTAHGATVVHHVRLAEPDAVLPPAVAYALAQVADAAGAATVLLSSTLENKEVAARLALLTDAGLVVDATGVERGEDGHLVVTQQAFAATWALTGQVVRPRAVVAVKANSVPAETVDAAAAPEVREHTVDAADAPGVAGLRLVERTARPASDRPGLAEAQVVVAGGRGTDGDFSAVEELADVLGAAVGATRVATDEGWIGHEAQIGQTGVMISPKLYIGAGISGAVHHRGGMQSSGTIVAVNADPEAPIFEIADFGVVGDLFTVLPQAAAEIRRLRG